MRICLKHSSNLLLFFLLLVFLCNKTVVSAQTESFTCYPVPVDTVSLLPFTSVHADPTLRVSVDEIIASSFTPIDTSKDFDVKAGINYWFKFAIHNPSEDTLKRLLYTVTHSSGSLYTLEDSTATRIGSSGDICSYEEVSYRDNYRFLRISIPPGETITYLLRIEEFLEKHSFQLYIATEQFADNFMAAKRDGFWLSQEAFHGIFFGILVFFLILSFSQYFANRQPAFLYYGWYLIATIFMNIKRVSWLFGREPESMLSQYRYLLLYTESIAGYLMIVSYLIFVRYFLDLPKVDERVNQFFQVLVNIFLALIAVDALLRLLPAGYQYSFFIYTYSRAVVFAVFFVTIGYLLKNHGNPLFRYILVGTTLLILPLLLVLIFHLIKEDYEFGNPLYKTIVTGNIRITMYTSRVGVLLEIICFYMGLAHLNTIYQRQKVHYENLAEEKTQELTTLKTEMRRESSGAESFLLINHRTGSERVSIQNILYLAAEGNQCFVYLKEGQRYLVSQTLKKMLTELPEDEFLRIHRSHAIRLKTISAWEHRGNGAALTLTDGTTLSVSRAYKAKLLDIVQPKV